MTETEDPGINIHFAQSGEKVGGWSTGCTAIFGTYTGKYSAGYESFLKVCKDASNKERIPYLVVSSKYIRLYREWLDEVYSDGDRCTSTVNRSRLTKARHVVRESELITHPEYNDLYLPSFVTEDFAVKVIRAAAMMRTAQTQTAQKVDDKTLCERLAHWLQGWESSLDVGESARHERDNAQDEFVKLEREYTEAKEQLEGSVFEQMLEEVPVVGEPARRESEIVAEYEERVGQIEQKKIASEQRLTECQQKLDEAEMHRHALEQQPQGLSAAKLHVRANNLLTSLRTCCFRLDMDREVDYS